MKTLHIGAGRKVLVTSDTHYGHRKIIGYCRRPWLYLDSDNRRREAAGEPYEISDRALKAHDDALVEAINERAGPGDILLLLGDVAWGEPGGTGLRKLQEFYDRLLVRNVVVIAGNHDAEDDLRKVFGDGYVHERLMVTVDGPGGRREAVLDHYPGYSWDRSHHGCWQLFGHVHGNLDGRHETNPAWLLSLDVGVDSHDYRPWLWHEELVPLMDRRRPEWQKWKETAYAVPKDRGGMAENAGLRTTSVGAD